MKLPVNLAELQKGVIEVFHLQDVKARKGYSAAHGIYFKRGDVGGLLDEACLALFPNRGRERFLKVINEKGVILVHFGGNIMTIPADYLCKIKNRPEQATLGI